MNYYPSLLSTNHFREFPTRTKMAESSDDKIGVYPPPARLQAETHVKNVEQYQEMYQKSINDPVGFWSDIAKNFHWETPPGDNFLEYNFDVRKGNISIKWMEGAKTNICFNALDRHVNEKTGDKIAFYW